MNTQERQTSQNFFDDSERIAALLIEENKRLNSSLKSMKEELDGKEEELESLKEQINKTPEEKEEESEMNEELESEKEKELSAIEWIKSNVFATVLSTIIVSLLIFISSSVYNTSADLKVLEERTNETNENIEIMQENLQTSNENINNRMDTIESNLSSINESVLEVTNKAGRVEGILENNLLEENNGTGEN